MVATIKIDVGNPSLVQRLLDAFIPSGSVDKSEQDLKTRCFQNSFVVWRALVYNKSSPEVELFCLKRVIEACQVTNDFSTPQLGFSTVICCWLHDASLASKVNFYSFDELRGAEMYLGIGGEGLLIGRWRDGITLPNRFANGFLNRLFIGEPTRSWMTSGKFVGSANFFSTASTVLQAFTYIIVSYILPLDHSGSSQIITTDTWVFHHTCWNLPRFWGAKNAPTRSFCNAQGNAESLRFLPWKKVSKEKVAAVPTGRSCAKIESSLIPSCCNWHHGWANRFIHEGGQDESSPQSYVPRLVLKTFGPFLREDSQHLWFACGTKPLSPTKASANYTWR